MSRAPGEGRHPLPTAEAFAASAGRAGIGPGVFVVAYDQGMTGAAARLWWLLRHFGHEDVAVLDGGMGAWLGRLPSGDEEIEPAEFVAQERSDDIVSAEQLLTSGPGLLLLDARPPERYRGEVEPLDPVPGHIPGALSWPWEQHRSVPAQALAAKEVVVYCGSGVTACVDLLALHRAGRTDARLYPGSWSEWSRRGLPAETG